MVCAMTLLPFMDALSKFLVADYPSWQITWARNAVHALVLLPFALARYGTGALRPAHLPLQLLRGFCFGVATACYVFSMRFMPLADAVALIFLFPFLVTMLSPVFLGERIGVYRWGAVATGFAGILLVIRPGFAELNPGVPFSVVAAFLTAGYIITTRKLRGTAPTLVMLLFPALVSALLLSTTLFVHWVTPDLSAGLIMLAIGMLGATVHWLIILAYRYAEASQIVSLAYLQVVVTVLLGYLFFAEVPSVYTWAGIALIVASGVFIGWRETRSSG